MGKVDAQNMDDVNRMERLAPNLSAIVGSAVAAKLMHTADGLMLLAKMRPRQVELLGFQNENVAGLSTTSDHWVRYLELTEIFQNTPPNLRMFCRRLLAAKCTIAARVDYTGEDPTGNTGMILRNRINEKIEKLLESG